MAVVTIGQTLAEQYDRVWGTLRDALGKMSDQQWRESDCDWLTPVRQAYHIVETAEFYAGAKGQGYKWGSLGGNWEESPSAELPSQAQMLAFLERVQATVRKWLVECGDAEYLLPEAGFAWTGGTRLSRALYSLRHAQHHLGQLNAELRRKGLARGEWA